MSSKIINFYKKTNESKIDGVVDDDSIISPREEDITVGVDKKTKQDNLEPLDKFFQTLVETLKKEKENSKIVKDTEALTQDTTKQTTLGFIDNPKESEQEDIISTKPVLLEGKIKQAILGFIDQLKESNDDIVANKIEKLPEKFANKLTKASEKKEEKINEEIETNSVKREEKRIVSTPVKKEENTYVAQLKSEDKIYKNQTKLEKISDIKGFVAQQIKEEINKFRQQYPNLGFGGGGGTNAVQYANGGVMNGDLTVNGRYLSGGVDIADFFTKSQGDRLITGNKNLILNTDGTVSFPDQTIAAPQEEMLTISSSNTSVNAFTKIVLSPYGFFVYDENSNSITFDTVDNDIVLTTLDNNEWKFDSEGVLTGPNGTLVVKDFNSIGKILSGGRDLTDIFLTTETDSQTLSFNSNTKDLSISNGNAVSLSSLVDNETYFSQASSKYENLITLVQSNSANWAKDNSTDIGLRSLSGNWQQTYTLVQSNSANWNLITISDPIKFNFIGDGSTVTYNVSGTNKSSNPAYIEVFVENVRQEPVISYTLSSDKVTFLQAPELDTSIVIITPNTKLFNSTTNEYIIPYYTVDAVTGQSAYEIWLSQGYNGTVSDFLSSIKGKDGIDGQSAYQIWQSQGSNATGTISDFLNSIKGRDGANGINGLNGINGQSAYDIWLLQGNTGTRQDFLNDIKGVDGANAYEIWLSAGNTGTISNFLSSIKGASGVNGTNGSNGANAYEIWLSAGNTGTVSVFLSSIKGEKGEKGDIGYTGQNAYEIWLSEGNIGTVNDFLNSLVGPKGNTGDTVTNTDSLTEGSVNLFYRSDRVEDDSPVKSVANKQGNITLDIDDILNLRSTLNSKQPSGNYVELVNNLIPSIYLPGTVDEIQEFSNYTLLLANPTPSTGVLYITTDNNKVYRWSGTLYVEIVSSPGTTDSLVEGSSNKYFTTQRASDAAPVQSVANKTGNVLLGVSDIQNLQTSLTATNTTTTAITARLSTPIGAYSNNSVIPINTPFEVILRNLLTTVIPYVYVQPVLTVSPSPATLSYEIGTNLNQTLNISYTQNDAGSATQFRVRSGTNTLSSTSTATPFISAFQLTSTTTFTTEVDYLAGQQKPNNVGDLQPNPVQAGTRTTTTTFAAFRNNFYTADTATVSATSSNQIRQYSNSTTSRSFNIPIVPGVKRVSFAFPSNLSNINVTVIQVGFGDITSSFKSSTVSVAGANNYLPINYSVYTLLVPSGFLQNQTYSVSF